MKKSAVLIFALFLVFGITFVAGFNPPGSGIEGIILKISSSTNAHGEMFNGSGNYNIGIRYNETFGHIYPRLNLIAILSFNPTYPHTICTGTNKILRLSGDTNAHAESPAKTTAGYRDICYGQLQCRYSTGNCLANEKCVVTLSSDTNAHIAECSATGSYSNKICCKESCRTFQDRTGCWQVPEYGCTWTPITNSTGGKILTDVQGGGCCAPGYLWDGGACSGTYGTPCTIPFTDTIALNPKSVTNLYGNNGPLNKNTKKYCAQVTAGVNTGIWYDPAVY